MTMKHDNASLSLEVGGVCMERNRSAIGSAGLALR